MARAGEEGSAPSKEGAALSRATPLVLARLIAAGITFTIPLVLARRMALEEYGTYKQLFLLAMTLSTLLPFGMTQGLYFFLPRAQQRRPFIFQTYLFLLGAGLLGATLVLALAGTAAERFSNPALLNYRWVLAIYLFGFLGANALETTLTSQGKTKLSGLIYVSSEVLKAFAIITPVLLGYGLHGAMLGLCGFVAVRLVFAWALGVGRAEGPLGDPAGFARQLSYALPYGAAMLLSVPQALAHQYAVSFNFPPEVFALYAVGCFQLPLVDMLYQPTTEVLMVRIGELDRAGRLEQGARVFRAAAARLAFFFVPMAVFLFSMAPEFIGALFGEKFLSSASIFRVAVLGVVLSSLPMDGVLRARGETRYIFFSYFVKAAVTVPLLWAGIHYFGLIGAIAAWAVAEVIGKTTLLLRLPHALASPTHRPSLLELLPTRRFFLAAASALFATLVISLLRRWIPLEWHSLPHSLLGRLVPLVFIGALFGLSYLLAWAVLGPRVEPPPDSLRIAVLMNLAPRKLGSFEGWISALCEEARSRGHQIDVFGRTPVLPEFALALSRVGAGWHRVDDLEASTWKGIARLARYDAIHLNMFVPRSRMAFMAYLAWPARILFVDHTSGPSVLQPPVQLGIFRLLIRRVVDRLTVFRITAIAGVSDYVSARNRQRFHLGSPKVRTVYNGIDVDRFAPSARPASPTGLFTVLAVAHLIPDKGIHFLIRALGRMRHGQARLCIVGDGPQRPELEALAAELGIADRVEFAGLRSDVPTLLARADAFAHPAIWTEAFGLTIAEAMSMGRPVVASAVGGIPELIENGETGMLVLPGDPAALAVALDTLANDEALRQTLGAAARRRVVERFGLQRCVEQHLSWCEEMVPRLRRGKPAAVGISPVKG